jgi:Fur family ferric uptake transcriptional regulator
LEHYPAIDPATVYRTLETLENSGLAIRVALGDRLTRWAHLEHLHHHLVCRACGETVDMEDEPFQRLAADLEDAYGVRVDLHHIVLHGLCNACREKSDRTLAGELHP